MSKLKTFKRDDVLDQAISVFWRKGYADTSINDLEEATALKKSSLYAEFKNKEDIFICSLDHYTKTCNGAGILDLQPLGWHNIEHLLRSRVASPLSETGCFIVFSMREHGSMSLKSQRQLEEHVSTIRADFFKNIAAEKTRNTPEMVTEVLMTFFVGMALNHNLRLAGARATSPVDEVMSIIKAL